MSLDLEEEPLPSAAEPECKVWTDGGFAPDHLCAVTDDVVAVHDGTNVTFVFLKTGKSRVMAASGGGGCKGISCLTGRDDLSLLAWSDLGPGPAVHVFQYAAPADVKTMEGDTSLEYVSLALNQKGLLVALSGVPDYRLTLWNWETEELVCSVESGLQTTLARVSFSPDAAGAAPPSKSVLVSAPSEGLALWKVKRCGQRRRLMREPVASVAAEGRMQRRHEAAAWHHGGGAVFVLDLERELFRYDFVSGVLSSIAVDDRDGHLSRAKNLEMRAHFDGLIVVAEKFFMVLDIKEETARRVQFMPLDQMLMLRSVSEFNNTFSYVAWTLAGNLFLMQTTETAVASKRVWENDSAPRYVDLALVRPDETVLAAITDCGRLRLFDIVGKDQVLNMRLDHPLSFVVGHPRCPVLILGTKCGRLLSVALRLSHVQVEEVYEDLEVLEGGGGGGGGSEGEKQTETVVRVEAKLSLTLDLHNRALRIPVVEESQGNTMLIAGEDGRLFLVGLLEEEGSFLSVLGSTKVEGEVTDATFRDGTALCLLASEDEAGFRQRRSFSWMGRQICHVRIAPDGKMAIVNMMELKDLCCGIALDRSGCYFFTFILRRKSLGKFVLQEEDSIRQRLTPVSRTKTTHQLGIRSIRLLDGEEKDDDTLITCGLDGRINLCPASIGGGRHMRQKLLFHYQRDGVSKAAVLRGAKGNNADGITGFCAVDARGTLVVHEVRQPGLTEEEEEERIKKLIRDRVPPSPEKLFVSTLLEERPTVDLTERMIEETILRSGGIRGKRREKDLAVVSWSEMKEESDLLADRKAYEGEIADIENNLFSIKEQVAKLLELNEELPEEERLERSEFELNTEEKQRRVAAGQDREAGLHLELKAWQVARKRAGLNIRKQVWDDLEVPGRAIRGLGRDLVVRNYPLLPVTEEEAEELVAAQAERKTALDFKHLTVQMQQDVASLQQELAASASTPRTARGSDSLRASSRQNVSPRDLSAGSSARAGRRGAGASGDLSGAASPRRDGRFMGSLSHEFIGFDGAQQLPQGEVTTRLQIVQQMTFLKNVVRKLKQHFNVEFDELFSAKEEALKQIQDWLGEYSAEDAGGGDEGGQQRGDSKNSKGEQKHQLGDFQWTAAENPLLDLPEKQDKPKGDDGEVPDQAGAKHALGRDREPVLLTPDFMTRKRSVEYSPAEVSSADDFRSQSERLSRGASLKRRGGRNDRVRLERQVDEAVERFDRRLAALYAKRLAVEKCVLTEELKMRLLDKKLSDMEDLEAEEKRLKRELAMSQERLRVAETELQEGREALASMRERLVSLHDRDKAMEKNFKKAFPALNYNQLEALMKSFKRRPNVGEAVEKNVDVFAKKDLKRKAATADTKRSAKNLHAKSIASTLERMSNMFLGTALTKPASSSASSGNTDGNSDGKIAFTLDELDLPSNCPESVDAESWGLMCKLRRDKIRSEEGIAQLVMELAETEESVQDREDTAAKTSEGLSDAQEHLSAWKRERNRRVNNVELVLTVARGQLEVEAGDTEPEVPGAVLLTESVVRKLNQEIERLGESKLAAMTESKDFRAGTRMLQWEKDKLLMELGDLQAKWTDIQQIKLSKESRQALQSSVVASPSQPPSAPAGTTPSASTPSAAGTSSSAPAITDEYAQLDRSSRASDAYLSRRSAELDETLRAMDEAIRAKDEETARLEAEAEALEAEAEVARADLEEKERRLEDLRGDAGVGEGGAAMAMQRNKLQQKIQEQHELILSLQEQLDTYIYRSFPSLG